MRLEERVHGVAPTSMMACDGQRWSMSENIGHLLDLEPLWSGRIDDLESGQRELRPADLENRKTHQADHNRRSPDELLAQFRSERSAIIARLEGLSDDLLHRESLP